MPNDADKNMIIEIDKKLGILISKVEDDIKASSEFKSEVKTEISKLQERVRALELTEAGNEAIMSTFVQVRNTLIKWFVGIACATLAGAYVLLTTKGL
jgi:hypothetical protein